MLRPVCGPERSEGLSSGSADPNSLSPPPRRRPGSPAGHGETELDPLGLQRLWPARRPESGGTERATSCLFRKGAAQAGDAVAPNESLALCYIPNVRAGGVTEDLPGAREVALFAVRGGLGSWGSGVGAGQGEAGGFVKFRAARPAPSRWSPWVTLGAWPLPRFLTPGRVGCVCPALSRSPPAPRARPRPAPRRCKRG